MKAQIYIEKMENSTSDDQNLDQPNENHNEGSISIVVEANQGSSRVCVFGTCLEHLMRTSPCLTVPYVVSRLCKFIEKYGLCQPCLFQETQEKSVVDKLKKKFNELGDAPLESSGDVPAASILLKLFFEELPEPLIPTSVQADFFYNIKDFVVNSGDCVKHLKFLVDKLPCSVFCVLKYLSHFLFQVSVHGKTNGLSSANLGLIFGPVIFRPAKKDPVVCIMVKNITHCFVADYYSIFEEKCLPSSKCVEVIRTLEHYSSSDMQISPLPSTVMPGVLMQPLQVMIPPLETIVHKGDHTTNNDLSSPLLLIESRDLQIMADEVKKMPACTGDLKNKIGLCSHTRKRKENLSEESISLSCNTDGLPSLLDLLETTDTDYSNREFEEVQDHQPVSDICRKNEFFSMSAISSEKYGSVDHSPHPPDPKRRELDSMDYPRLTQKYEKNAKNIKYSAGLKPWLSINQLSDFSNKAVSFKDYNVTLDLALQNGEATDEDKVQEEQPNMESSLHFLDKPLYDGDNSTSGTVPPLPRSSSCPISITDGESSFESESTSLSHSWNMLFDSEEPVRSDRHRIWSVMKGNQEEEPVASSIRNHQKLNSNDAPLSPSAYRSYLSHRGPHLDPSVPPSPPTEQEHFEKNHAEDPVTCSIKQLTKKIYALKKKIWRFEEKYESEYGYKPSHAEKTKFPEAKKLMTELHKVRKELKALKEESHVMSGSCNSSGNWFSTREVHILEDTTNCLKDGSKDSFIKTKPSVQTSFGETLKSLNDDRKLANRPELIEQMSSEQVKDEKLAIQKVLLQFESIHGKPCKTADRNTVRPLYERYRNVKSLLVRSNSYPACTSKGNSCKSLQPIMEHETMDFSSLQDSKEGDSACLEHDVSQRTDVINAEIDNELSSSNTNCTQSLDNKYNNSNLHELPLPEMISQQQHARTEKRRLRKILREFEAEFLRINGRKVQKEDKAPVEALYTEYKLVKARLRLLEALISKHHEHILV